MLDPKLLRNDLEWVAGQLSRRGFVLDTDSLQALEARRKDIQMQTQQLQAERNARSKGIGKAKAAGEDIAPLLKEEGLGSQLKQKEDELADVQDELNSILLGIPNIPHESVPDGKGEEDNPEIRRWGEPPAFDFEPKDHVDLGEHLGQLDFETAAKLTGSRFSVMQGPLARLHRALIQFMLDTHTRDHGYREVYVPYMVNADSLRGTGQLPKFEDDLFKLAGDSGYYLIPTAEVPVTNLARDTIVEAESLPLRYSAHGATGSTRGLAGRPGRTDRTRRGHFAATGAALPCR
jgi:seryl-tRNA synthetase